MGKLAYFNLDVLLQRFDLRHFVETGTGGGDSVHTARQYPFTTIWSCDIEHLLIEPLRHMQDERVHLFIGRSVQMLDLLPTFPVGEPILFWLDAHFPGADYGLRSYDAEPDETIRLPLKHELQLIKQHRPADLDVILIDDARLWLDGPFRPIREDLVEACTPTERGVEFIVELFQVSHDLTLLHDHEGFIVLTPRLT